MTLLDDNALAPLNVEHTASRFGTPLYLYDGAVLRRSIDEVRAGLDPRISIFFSMKANPNIAILQVLRRGGACAEVSSAVELETAVLAGISPSDIIFLGPGKSAREIERCLELGIYAIVCESFQELDLIDTLAAERGGRARVVVRMNADFEIKGSGLTMGGKPRQFGIDEAELLSDGVVLHRPHVDLIGVHAYMGTRILAAETIVANTERILERAVAVSERHGFPLEFVDVGGGWGIPYFENETPLDAAAVFDGINARVALFAAQYPRTRIAIELGRYLVAPSGTYVTRVRYTKRSLGESFAVTDGGTNHHMAAVGVGSFVKRNFPTVVLTSDDRCDAELEIWNVTGPLCTPNDVIAKRAALPPIRVGDLIGIERSGAYGPTASPGLFLSHGYPAEVLLLDGQTHLIREADSASDLLAKQRALPSP